MLELSAKSIGQDINLSFQHLDSKDGLTVGYNDFIYKDSRGFVWISSFQGLFRYDGVVIDKIQNSTHGILDDNIQSPIFEDADGNLWFSTVLGINSFERETNRFRTFQIVPEGTTDTITEGYHLFHVEGDSMLWTRARDEIYIYKIKENKAKFIAHSNGVRFAVEKEKSDGKVKHIYACPWENEPGLYQMVIKEDELIKTDTLLRSGFVKVNGALFDAQKGLWVFTDQGLMSYDSTRADKFISYPSPDLKQNIVFGGSFQGDSILVGLRNGGLGVFDLEKRKYVYSAKANQNDPSSLSANDLKRVYRDREDNIWVSNWTRAGVDYSWIHSNRFIIPSQSKGNITSIIEDREGNIWSATTNNGVTVLYANSNFSRTFHYGQELGTPKGFNAITQLSLSPSGEVWALNDHYIFRYQAKKRHFKEIYDGNSMNLSRLVHLSETAKLLSTNYGIYELIVNSSQEKAIVKKSKIVDSNTVIFNFFQDESGNLYLPGLGNQLHVYKKKSEYVYEKDSVVIPGQVYSIEYMDDTKVVWIGSSEGLYKLDLNSLEVKSEFSDMGGKPFTQVLGVTRDTSGYLWLSTTNGLWRYDSEVGKTLVQFRREDGLPTLDFSFFSHLRANNGDIWLGSSEGPIVFSPMQIKPYPFNPRIQLKSIFVNQQDFSKELPIFIGELDHLRLKYWQNNLEFDAVAINNYHSKLNKICYRLTNYDDRWQTEENGSIIRFIGLRPGNYILELKGISANGIEGPIKRLSITIVPAIWQMSLVQLVFFMVLGLSTIWLYRFLLKGKVRRKTQEIERREKALQSERDRIAAEMHDDLGGELTAINFLIKKTLKESISSNAARYLAKIEQYASNSVESMSEIIWAMNSSYDNLDQLIAYIRRYAAEVLDENDIEYKATIARNIPAFRVSGKKRRNIYLTIKEAIHNIIRHANATLVTLHIYLGKDEKVLHIVLSDNGVGIGEDRNRFGNGVRNMHLRMKEINAEITVTKQNGTQISLKIPIKYNA